MFGEFLKGLMQKRKISQKRLGKRSGVSQGNISRTVRGQVGFQNPTLRIAQAYARALTMNFSEFIEQYEAFLIDRGVVKLLKKPGRKPEVVTEKFSWRKFRKKLT